MSSSKRNEGDTPIKRAPMNDAPKSRALGSSILSSAWSPIGPYQVYGIDPGNLPCAGRIDRIDISPDYDGAGHAAMYLAMPGGGVWRSGNSYFSLQLYAYTWSTLIYFQCKDVVRERAV